MTPQTPEQIAGRLTKAQREFLLRHHSSAAVHHPHWQTLSTRDERSYHQVGIPLREAGLIKWAGPQSDRTVLTPRGLEVRSALALANARGEP